MKILVVGGSGFLGVQIVQKLQANGHEVITMSRHPSSEISAEQLIADIGFPRSYERKIANLAAEAVIQGAWVTQQDTYRTSDLNKSYHETTISFAQFCLESGVEHFLALGSSAEYGNPTEPCDARTTSTRPTDLYGESKLATMEQLQTLSRDPFQKVSWARVFQPYGTNQDLSRLIPHAVAALKSGSSVKVKNPDSILDWISSRDIASAIAFVLNNSVDSIFDIGTSIGTSVLSLLHQLADLVGANRKQITIEDSYDRSTPALSLVVSAKSPLLAAGWRPEDDLKSGLHWALGL